MMILFSHVLLLQDIKIKINMLTEHAHIDKMNKKEDLDNAVKFFSKTHCKHVFIVLQCAFVTMDQSEEK